VCWCPAACTITRLPPCPFPHQGWELDLRDELEPPQHLLFLPLPWASSLEAGAAAGCCCCTLRPCSELRALGMRVPEGCSDPSGMEHNCSSGTVATQGSRSESYPQNQTVRCNWHLLQLASTPSVLVSAYHATARSLALTGAAWTGFCSWPEDFQVPEASGRPWTPLLWGLSAS